MTAGWAFGLLCCADASLMSLPLLARQAQSLFVPDALRLERVMDQALILRFEAPASREKPDIPLGPFLSDEPQRLPLL